MSRRIAINGATARPSPMSPNAATAAARISSSLVRGTGASCTRLRLSKVPEPPPPSVELSLITALPRRDGTVKAVYVTAGQRVQQGAPLLVLL